MLAKLGQCWPRVDHKRYGIGHVRADVDQICADFDQQLDVDQIGSEFGQTWSEPDRAQIPQDLARKCPKLVGGWYNWLDIDQL